MRNKKYKKMVIIALTSSLLLYFSFAFVILELNPLKWEKFSRFIFVLFLLASKLMVYLIVDNVE